MGGAPEQAERVLVLAGVRLGPFGQDFTLLQMGDGPADLVGL